MAVEEAQTKVDASEEVDMSAFARAPETEEERARRHERAAAAQAAADAFEAKVAEQALAKRCETAKAAIVKGGDKSGVNIAEFELLLKAAAH